MTIDAPSLLFAAAMLVLPLAAVLSTMRHDRQGTARNPRTR